MSDQSGVVVSGITDEFGESTGMSDDEVATFNSRFESLFKKEFDKHESPFAGGDTPEASTESEPSEDASAKEPVVAAGSDAAGTGDEASTAEIPGTPSPTPDATSADAGTGEPPSTETPESDHAFTLAGATYTEPELTQALAVHQWFAQLPQPTIAAIDALLSGQYQLVPIVAPQQPGAGPTTQPTPLADEEEWLDPRAETEINRLRQEIDSLKGTVTSTTKQQADATLNQQLTIVKSTTDAFATEYGLDETQMGEIVNVLNRAQILPGLHHQHGGDVAKAMRAGLEMTLWSTPTLRDSVLARQSEIAAQEHAQQEQDERRKQQQLSALAGSGGSAPRRDPIPRTAEDRHRAMRDTIATAMAERPQ